MWLKIIKRKKLKNRILNKKTLNFVLTFSGLKNREERERQYFDTGLPATSSALMNEDVVEDDELYDRVSHLLLFPKGCQMFDIKTGAWYS